MSDKKYVYLSVVPPEQSYFIQAEYLLDKNTLLPEYCRLLVADGTELQLHFATIRRTSQLSEGDFDFKIPEGAIMVADPLSGEHIENQQDIDNKANGEIEEDEKNKQ